MAETVKKKVYIGKREKKKGKTMNNMAMHCGNKISSLKNM